MNAFTQLSFNKNSMKPLPSLNYRTTFPSFDLYKELNWKWQVVILKNTIGPNLQFGVWNCYKFSNKLYPCVLGYYKMIFKYKRTSNHKDLKTRTHFSSHKRNSSEIERKEVLLTYLIKISYSIQYAIFYFCLLLKKKLQGRWWEKIKKSLDCSKKEVSD